MPLGVSRGPVWRSDGSTEFKQRPQAVTTDASRAVSAGPGGGVGGGGWGGAV